MKNEKDCVSKSERRLRNFALIRRDESQAVSSDYTLGKHGFTGLRVSEKSGRESQFFSSASYSGQLIDCDCE